MQVKDLPDLFNRFNEGIFLFCPNCESRYSAHSGDYFMAKPETTMRCECGAETILVKEICSIIEVNSDGEEIRNPN